MQIWANLDIVRFINYLLRLKMRILKVILATIAIVASGLTLAQTKIIVTHPEVPPVTLLDHGKPGQSIGDVRLWHFPAKADDGSNVMTDWILTTTGVVSEKGMEYRITSAVFSFDDGTKDQIVIQGVAKYPSAKATLEESASTKRAITGGTGKFGGIGGWIETEHLADGSWRHTLYIK
jgi:hypothetical protein